jgi:ABC transporter substrate binding protein/Universal stress protein family
VIHVEHEHPYSAIIDAANKNGCDLIAMASHGRRGLSAVVLGSETVKVLTHSNIPVLVYRSFPPIQASLVRVTAAARPIRPHAGAGRGVGTSASCSHCHGRRRACGAGGKAATAKIPLVVNLAEDPVRLGFVASLNRPGGNITGVTSLLGAQGAKQLGLLRELVPQASIMGMLVDPSMPWAESLTTETQSAARAVGQQLIVAGASSEREIDATLAALVQQRAGALLVTASPFFFTRADYLIGLVARHALPAVYWRREIAEAGGLMSYGSSTAELYGQVGVYAGKILNGAKPADLPILQPTKFEFVINVKTAKALGVKVSDNLLSLADEVIE